MSIACGKVVGDGQMFALCLHFNLWLTCLPREATVCSDARCD